MKIYVAYVEGLNKYPWEGSLANKGRVFYETYEEAISCTADLIQEQEDYTPNEILGSVLILEYSCWDEDIIDAVNGDYSSFVKKDGKTMFELKADNKVIFDVFRGLTLVEQEEVA